MVDLTTNIRAAGDALLSEIVQQMRNHDPKAAIQNFLDNVTYLPPSDSATFAFATYIVC